MGENIKETERFEDWQWWYTRTFTAPEERENVYLVFEGVDCIAEYYLNGQMIGSIFARSQNLLWASAQTQIQKEALVASAGCCEVVAAELGEQIGDFAAIAAALL